MKLDVVAVAPFASVTVIDTVDEPVTVGVPEMVPVDELKFRPFTNVPVKANQNAERPPEMTMGSENELSAVPDKPLVGVVNVSASPTATNATVDVVVMEMPERVLVTSTV